MVLTKEDRDEIKEEIIDLHLGCVINKGAVTRVDTVLFGKGLNEIRSTYNLTSERLYELHVEVVGKVNN